MPRPTQPHAQPKVLGPHDREQAEQISVEDARLALEAHLLTCPGSHFECYGNRELERKRLVWLEEKAKRETDLASAIGAAAARWKAVEHPVHSKPVTILQEPPEPVQEVEEAQPAPDEAPEEPAQPLGQEAQFEAKLARLRTLGPESRRRAAYLRWELRQMCSAMGRTVPPELELQPRGGDNRRTAC